MAPQALALTTDELALEALWESLSKAVSPADFLDAWLSLQCHLIPGTRSGLVLLEGGGTGTFAPAGRWPAGRTPGAALRKVAETALVEQRGAIVEPPQPGELATLEGALIAEPIRTPGTGSLRGVIALEVAPRTTSELRGLLQQLRWGTGWLDSAFRRMEPKAAAGGARARLELVLGVLAATLDQERFTGAATAFATELATALDCDRVSVGLVRRERVKLRALSHSAQFQGKTNLVRAIEAAMDEALDQRALVVFPVPDQALPQATHAHAELAREHGAGAICTVPLVTGAKPAGALTLERSGAFDADAVRVAEAAAALAAPVLRLHARDDRWLVAKAWELLATKTRDLIGPHHVALKLTTAATLGVIAFFAFAMGDYRVTADTVLEPRILRAAVVSFDGFIGEGHVRAGDLVEQGQLLARLDDRDLLLEQAARSSQRDQALKQYRRAMAERDAARAEIYSAEIAEQRAELARIEDQLAKAELRAPFDGVIVTGDLSQKLGAPVARGDVLFEVAPLDAYRVILKVDESDVADVRPGQRGRLILSSEPSTPLELSVESLTPVSTAAEGINYFRVEATLVGSSTLLRPGMEGVAKIEVDRRRLIWVWTHDVIDWLRLTLWRWTP